MDKFPVLGFVSLMLALVGLPLIFTGIYFGLYEGVIEPNLQNHHFKPEDLIQLAGGMLALCFGLILVAAGESIRVVLEIEKNTRGNLATKAPSDLSPESTKYGPSGEAI